MVASSDVPVIGYRNLQIVGRGGTGRGGNKGIYLDSLLATDRMQTCWDSNLGPGKVVTGCR